MAYVNSIYRHIQRAIPVYPLRSLPTILSFFLSGSPLSLQMQMGPKHLQTTLTRTKLEQLTLHIVEKIRDPLMKVLADTHLEPKGMDKIILIGGMTRMPLVRKFVEDIIGKPAETGVDPMECVAVGAAIQGSILGGDS